MFLFLFFLIHHGLPGIGSSREQVDGFNKQLEVLLFPAFPSTASPSSSTGLLRTTGGLPCLDLSLLLLLELYIDLLDLKGGGTAAARCLRKARESPWP